MHLAELRANSLVAVDLRMWFSKELDVDVAVCRFRMVLLLRKLRVQLRSSSGRELVRLYSIISGPLDTK